ncbi:MAG: hypothetical protein ABJ157_07925 [Marinobacter sp.]|uniref:hypothetical protein n=1 Tax=Marinobacter sp. TaxID=50741 RepID=UPI003297D002
MAMTTIQGGEYLPRLVGKVDRFEISLQRYFFSKYSQPFRLFASLLQVKLYTYIPGVGVRRNRSGTHLPGISELQVKVKGLSVLYSSSFLSVSYEDSSSVLGCEIRARTPWKVKPLMLTKYNIEEAVFGNPDINFEGVINFND